MDKEYQGSLWSHTSCCADVGTHKHRQQGLNTDVRVPLCRGLVWILYPHWKASRNFQDDTPSLPKQWVQSKFGCVYVSLENKAELAHWDAKELSGPMADAAEKHTKSLRKKPQVVKVVQGWFLTITPNLCGSAVLLISTNNRACKRITKCC